MLRICPQYQGIAPSTAHHISHKSVPKSRFVPASPQGEAFASAVQQLHKFPICRKKQAPRLGRPLSIDDARLAAAAVIVAAATVVAVGNSVAAATAVAEDQQQDNDPPPVVTAEAATDTIIIAHKITSDYFR